ncbi:MAG: hypothetical protein JRN68_01115 [Nitrososphaerota archaeon]|nr:hypothetical protein [Ferrimicrobium acidiphilum]MDG6933276.1 hypothetical protein [Nitrososphaerota archaeon]
MSEALQTPGEQQPTVQPESLDTPALAGDVEVKTTIRVNKNLLDAVQKVVKDGSSGKLRGFQNEAFTEALRLWLAYLGNTPALLVVDSKGGRKRVVSSDGIVQLLGDILHDATKVEFSIYPMSATSQNFEDGVLESVVKTLIQRIGKPPVARIGAEGAKSIELQGEGDGWEAKLQEAQERSDVPLELSLIWTERDLYASFRFESIEVKPFRQAPGSDDLRMLAA